MYLFKTFICKLRQVTSKAYYVKFNYVIFGACFLALVWICLVFDAMPYVPKHLRKYVQFSEDYKVPKKPFSETELQKLIFKVEQLNFQAEVVNWYKYQPVDAETTIIVILVHKDVERLQYLIISLGQVRYIWRVLLIFSHSYFDEEINNLVKIIDFCRVLQIFYPYSLQLYPNQFPGVDPDDCNVTHTKSPCFKRDASLNQFKQHWWWTAHYVFDGEWSSDKRITIFLEEDNYVLPDLLHILQLTRTMLPHFPAVEVMAFGGLHRGHLKYDSLMIDTWVPLSDRGLAFNLTTWKKIRTRSSFFCFDDDCRWSYSLMPVFANFTSGVIKMAECSAPRVLSTSGFANGRQGARWAYSVAKLAPLFPTLVRATQVGKRRRKIRPWRLGPRGSGGCSDIRDQMLCVDPLMAATTEAMTSLPSR